jgi:hypothetical protein
MTKYIIYTQSELNTIAEWAKRLTGMPMVAIVPCRPGQEMNVMYFRYANGRVQGQSVKRQAAFPGEWTDCLSKTRYVVKSDGGANWLTSIVKPTLYEFDGFTEGDTPYVQFIIFLPEGEPERRTDEEDKKRRREYAQRQRERLSGLSNAQITLLFDAAGVSLAVDAAELARDAIKVLGDAATALNVLSEVVRARDDEQRALLAKAKLRVRRGATNAQLKRILRGTTVLLGDIAM